MKFPDSFIQKLLWSHGAERTAAIISGQDASTNADLAAWRNLGGAPVRSMAKRMAEARRMLKLGRPHREVAETCAITLHAVRSIDGKENAKW